MRCAPRHLVLSKAMCWVALDRGIQLAAELDLDAPLDEWRRARIEICAAILAKGVAEERGGAFVQAFDRPDMDASLLLLPFFGFIDACDPRMVATVAAIREDLEEDGLLRRYPADGDGLEGREGTFLACTFWLAECLALQGNQQEARLVFDRAAAAGNDLGLFSEEYLPKRRMMLGNFPQGLTHLSLISAAVAIGRVRPPEQDAAPD
jgi:GH15 family glucan-1,4-alpha-glucosidase